MLCGASSLNCATEGIDDAGETLVPMVPYGCLRAEPSLCDRRSESDAAVLVALFKAQEV